MAQASMNQSESKWSVLFEGAGSATGNGWLEEVCYLGQDQWLLSLRDDPAWSGTDVDVQEPEEHTSETLANWAIDMDATDEDEEQTRVHALLDIAAQEGAEECVRLLRRHLDDANQDEEIDNSQSALAKGWRSLGRIRDEAKRRAEGGGDGEPQG